MTRLLSFIGQTDSDIVPHFLDHYRRMGVGAFHVFLQGEWTETELGPFRAPDVAVAGRLNQPFDDGFKRATLDVLAKSFRGEWLIVADADELLELPYESLDQTIKALEFLGLDELPGVLLQRVATGGALDPVSPLLPLDLQFPYCDFRLAERMNVAIPIWKSKYPLMRVGPDFELGTGHHLPSAGRASAHVPIRGLLHHYKWRDRLLHSLRRIRTNSNQHEQDAYRRWLDGHDNRLPTDGLALADRQALFAAGLLVRPTRAELRLHAALRRTPERDGPTEEGLAKIAPVRQQPGAREASLLSREGLGHLPGRVALVTPEFLGLRVTGGIGTAMSALAERLAAAGHQVEVFLIPHGEFSTLDRAWIGYWRARGVRIHQLSRALPQGRSMNNNQASLAVLDRLMAEGDWDVVHFCDSSGLGAAPLLHRAAGLGFGSTQMVVTVHGPTRWHRSGNLLPWTAYEAEISHLEGLSIELADVLVFPSDYMRGWTQANFPSQAAQLTIPNGLIAENRRFGRATMERRAVNTIVFFGRLELRKGLDRFISAIEEVLARGQTNFEVVFLGSLGQDHSEAQLRRRLEHWTCRIRIIVNLTSQEALDYLRSESCLVVIPSRVDNSPYTVYECLENGVPFIASDVGGIPELVHPDDRDRAIVQGGAEDYAARIADALENGAAPARLSFDPAHAELDLLALHGNLVETARRSRRRVTKVAPEAAVIVYGSSEDYGQLAGVLRRWALDGTTVRWDRNPHDTSGRGTDAAALNRFATAAQSEHLLFVHATVTPAVETLEAMLSAMAETRADAVVCGHEARDTGEMVPVFAGPYELSAGRNIYGARLLLVRREPFLAAGGFTTGSEMAEIVEWDLLNRLKALGGRVMAIPAAMASLASEPAPVLPSAHQAGQLSEPWTRRLAEPLSGFVRMALAQLAAADGTPLAGVGTRRAAPDMRGVGLSELLARRSGATGLSAPAAHPAQPPAKAVTRDGRSARSALADAGASAAAPSSWAGHETDAGRRAIGKDGRLLSPADVYTVAAAEDADGCDFLVADGHLEDRTCKELLAASLAADRYLLGIDGDVRGRSFLHFEELLALSPPAAFAIVTALRAAAAEVAGFHEVTAPLYPCRVTIEVLRPGFFALPSRPVGVEAGGTAFRCNLTFAAPGEGGDVYFTALGIAVRPRPGRLIGATATRYHEAARLAVVDGLMASVSFSLCADAAAMSKGLRRLW